MGRTIVVARHEAVKQWLAEQGVEADHTAHLDDATIAALGPGDRVIGPLPPDLMAKVVGRRAAYDAILFDTPPRGVELSVAEMKAAGARLEGFEVKLRPGAPRQPFALQHDRHRAFSRCLAARLSAGAGAAGARLARLPWLVETGRHIVAVLNGLAGFLRTSRPAFVGGGAVLGAVLLMGMSWIKEPFAAWTLCGLGVRPGDDCGTGFGLALALFVAGGALAGLSGYVLAEMGSRIATSSAAKVPPENGACAILVTGLSKEFTPQTIDAIIAAFRDDFAGYAAPGQIFGASPKVAAASPAAFRSSWQQTLRAIRYHRPRLKVAMLLPSAESLAQWDSHFVPLLRALCPGVRVGSETQPAPRAGVATEAEPFADLVVDLVRVPVTDEAHAGQGGRRDYEDYDYVRTGLEAGIEQARVKLPRNMFARESIDERDICIDITAGTKPFSIAGAIVTLNSDYRLGYVTNDGDVVVYDAQIRFASAQQ